MTVRGSRCTLCLTEFHCRQRLRAHLHNGTRRCVRAVQSSSLMTASEAEREDEEERQHARRQKNRNQGVIHGLPAMRAHGPLWVGSKSPREKGWTALSWLDWCVSLRCVVAPSDKCPSPSWNGAFRRRVMGSGMRKWHLQSIGDRRRRARRTVESAFCEAMQKHAAKLAVFSMRGEMSGPFFVVDADGNDVQLHCHTRLAQTEQFDVQRLA